MKSDSSLESRETTRKLLKMEQFKNDCSEIIKGKLYISGYSVASDLKALQQHGITHIGKIG
jgi:biotin operon repressor